MPRIHTTASDSNLALDNLPMHLPADQLKARLARLIRAAVNQGAAAVAETVAYHFQVLSLHPELASDFEERAAYCRGARHWRGLAAIGGPVVSHEAERMPEGLH